MVAVLTVGSGVPSVSPVVGKGEGAPTDSGSDEEEEEEEEEDEAGLIIRAE